MIQSLNILSFLATSFLLFVTNFHRSEIIGSMPTS